MAPNIYFLALYRKILLKVKVTQSCPSLYDPMNYTVHGFSRPEYWSGEPFPFAGDLPDPGVEPRSPSLQVDSFLAEPLEKPKNTGVGSLSLFQQIFQPRNRTGVSCIAGGFFTNWAIREASFPCLALSSFESHIFHYFKLIYNFIEG